MRLLFYSLQGDICRQDKDNPKDPIKIQTSVDFGSCTIIIDDSEIECDYYDYLNGKEELAKLYHGEYMAQYSFAEFTNANLYAKLVSHQ